MTGHLPPRPTASTTRPPSPASSADLATEGINTLGFFGAGQDCSTPPRWSACSTRAGSACPSGLLPRRGDPHDGAARRLPPARRAHVTLGGKPTAGARADAATAMSVETVIARRPGCRPARTVASPRRWLYNLPDLADLAALAPSFACEGTSPGTDAAEPARPVQRAQPAYVAAADKMMKHGPERVADALTLARACPSGHREPLPRAFVDEPQTWRPTAGRREVRPRALEAMRPPRRRRHGRGAGIAFVKRDLRRGGKRHCPHDGPGVEARCTTTSSARWMTPADAGRALDKLA